MSFEADLRETIQKARPAREQYEQDGNNFEREWLKLRSSVISGIFHEAKRAFEAERISAEVEQVNGSIALNASYDEAKGRFRYALKLRSEREKRMVVCSSSIMDIEEELFTLEHLTADVVQSKIKLFADYIARGSSLRVA